MVEYGIRQAKAHLSEIVRAAAGGACVTVTDNRKPVAMIGPLPADDSDKTPARKQKAALSEAAAFRAALNAAPYPFEIDL